MNPDGTEDVNITVFSGPEHNGSRHYLPETVGSFDTKYTAAVKFTRGVRLVVADFGRIVGGTENAIDMNNASFNEVSGSVIDLSRTKYGITIKGGSSCNDVNGMVTGHGKECDVDFDNWSDQAHAPCRGNLLNLRHAAGDAIRVRYIYEKPELKEGSGPYRFVFPWPWLPVPRAWIGKIFNQLRRAGFFR
jgi:hypothetical protein